MVIRAHPSRSAGDQASDMARNAGSPASIRRFCVTLQASRSITARSSGIPTDRFDRSVESIDRSTAFCPSERLVAGFTTRSRIGLPYLCSPICRKGVSSVASMKLPSG